MTNNDLKLFAQNHPKMEYLIFEYFQVNDKTIDYILQQMQKLKTISLFGCSEITDEVFKSFKNNSNLKSIDLSDTHITYNTVERFSKENPDIFISYEMAA